jgi:hypothetical protein
LYLQKNLFETTKWKSDYLYFKRQSECGQILRTACRLRVALARPAMLAAKKPIKATPLLKPFGRRALAAAQLVAPSQPHIAEAQAERPIQPICASR